MSFFPKKTSWYVWTGSSLIIILLWSFQGIPRFPVPGFLILCYHWIRKHSLSSNLTHSEKPRITCISLDYDATWTFSFAEERSWKGCIIRQFILLLWFVWLNRKGENPSQVQNPPAEIVNNICHKITHVNETEILALFLRTRRLRY